MHRRTRGRLCERGGDEVGRVGLVALDHLVEQRLLVAERCVQARRVDAHRLREVVDRRLVVALLPERLERAPDGDVTIEAGGRVIGISTGATRQALPDLVAYAMSKGALDVMGLTLAKALAPRGITVNTLAPGLVDTDVNAGWLRTSDEAWAEGAAMSAFNRVGEPDDIAGAVAFLASDDARWVTGHYLDATGGALL